MTAEKFVKTYKRDRITKGSIAYCEAIALGREMEVVKGDDKFRLTHRQIKRYILKHKEK